jgi:ankyrin repeat protein
MACHAIYFQKEEVFKFLMRKGTHPNLYSSSSILNYASRNGDEQHRLNIVKFLLENEADPNFTPPKEGSLNPLIISIKHGQITIVELLLRFGADPNSLNEFGETALWEASNIILLPLRFPMVKLLLEYNANSEDKSFLENISDPEEKKELEGLCYSKRKGITISSII